MKTVNDIDLKKWKEYPEILTDNLWVIDKRDSSGVHNPNYHGNFIPQVPYQMMLRYTKKGDWVLDPFMGMGTTLIEAKKLERNCIGVDICKDTVNAAQKLLDENALACQNNAKWSIHVGNSCTFDFKDVIQECHQIEKVQLIILHPPYHDIIKFSGNAQCLSNSKNINEFLNRFEDVVSNVYPFLVDGGHLVLVMGDKYEKGEWIPLGFDCMNEIMLWQNSCKLKSIVVKNFEETRGKRNQKSLWRYRALAGGFYVFKHEYIMIFRKG